MACLGTGHHSASLASRFCSRERSVIASLVAARGGWAHGAYVWRTEDGSVPVRHEQIITFGKTVGTGLCIVVRDIY